MRNNSPLKIELTDEDLRQVVAYSAACARAVLPLFETSSPEDLRPREAIVAAEAFAAGERRSGAFRATAWAALTAAHETDNVAACHAAYAASHAAAAAYLHPLASSHQVKHILGAAVHQVLALEDSDSQRLPWAISLANTSVRAILRRYPSPPEKSGRFNELLNELDNALR